MGLASVRQVKTPSESTGTEGVFCKCEKNFAQGVRYGTVRRVRFYGLDLRRQLCVIAGLFIFGCAENGRSRPTVPEPQLLIDADGDGVPATVDCNDTNPRVSPLHPESPYDGIDNDCLSSTLDDDLDNDGVPAAVDCDDHDESRYGGAVELCDGIDNDCDGEIDEGEDGYWYIDEDGDGYGSKVGSVTQCSPDLVSLTGDCDDQEGKVHPGAPEWCDGLDNNCDGGVDEESGVWFLDQDGDGFGDSDVVFERCEPGEPRVSRPGDCDDFSAAVSPAQPERCDGVDNDCDGISDEAPVGATWWALEGGKEAPLLRHCETPTGYTEVEGCTNEVLVQEVCNGLDDDCDGLVDESAADALMWFVDSDGDGWGGENAGRSCGYIEGASILGGDCDDEDPQTHPSAGERCDGIDNDCSGVIDELYASDAVWAFLDVDGDGFGEDQSIIRTCELEVGWSLQGGDCASADPEVSPGAVEVCDGLDQDCDGWVDEDAVDQSQWWLDRDGDGFGMDAVVQSACVAPEGYVSQPGDCDDLADWKHPQRAETCNGHDDDCDGLVDNDPVDPPTFYWDADFDGYGDPTLTRLGCALQFGESTDGTDCDDTDPLIHPHRDEICNGMDNDCDGQADFPPPPDSPTWLLDHDGDGFAIEGAQVITSCEAPSIPTATQTGDCDDFNSERYPGAPEFCDNHDSDCDGLIDEEAEDALTFWPDGDADGFGGGAGSVLACMPPSGFTLVTGDCDDTNPIIRPGAPELCDGEDQDCDGLTDEEAIDEQVFYADVDGDGFGGSASQVQACEAPVGFSVQAGDCDDADLHVSPAASETCNGADDDCDGAVDESGGTDSFYLDLDGDGIGAGPAVISCSQPNAMYTPWDGDCDDDNPFAFPGAPESCQPFDANCDGLLESDKDGDGEMHPACDGWDCDDLDPTLFPGEADCPVAARCLDILGGPYDAGTGWYLLDPDGLAGPETAMLYACEMDAWGGGWTRLYREDFESAAAPLVWNSPVLSPCDGGSVLVAEDGEGMLTTTVSAASFDHEEVWVASTVFAFDSWEGESFTVSVDGTPVFSETVDHLTHGGALQCAHNFWDDASYEMEAVLAHDADHITFEVASDLDQSVSDESLGLDEVFIWVR